MFFGGESRSMAATSRREAGRGRRYRRDRNSAAGRGGPGSVARHQPGREDLVEQRAGPAVPHPLDNIRSGHSQLIENQSCDERRPVESQAAVGQDMVTIPYERRTKPGDPMQLVQIGKLFVIDWEVDIEALVGKRWHTDIDVSVKVAVAGEDVWKISVVVFEQIAGPAGQRDIEGVAGQIDSLGDSSRSVEAVKRINVKRERETQVRLGGGEG